MMLAQLKEHHIPEFFQTCKIKAPQTKLTCFQGKWKFQLALGTRNYKLEKKKKKKL